jgi:hypothetical protein
LLDQIGQPPITAVELDRLVVGAQQHRRGDAGAAPAAHPVLAGRGEQQRAQFHRIDIYRNRVGVKDPLDGVLGEDPVDGNRGQSLMPEPLGVDDQDRGQQSLAEHPGPRRTRPRRDMRIIGVGDRGGRRHRDIVTPLHRPGAGVDRAADLVGFAGAVWIA